MNKAVIYCRVSTGEQDNSIELQKSKCISFCKLHGYEINSVIIDEGVSGSSKIFERPKGSLLKNIFNNNEADHLVIWKLDRISRNTLDGLETIEDLTSKGHTINIIDHGGMSINTSNPTGKLFLTLCLGFAEMERSLIKERITSVLRNKKEKGEVYSKHAPYGFKKSGKRLKVVDKEMDKVREFFSIMEDESIPKREKSYRKLAMKLQIDHSKLYRIHKNEIYQKYL
jgi:DNA invertase Pin-like site-specific DNA recombinase